jgi:YebC/PmpR family DNA-binding regulatory protein
MAGHSKWANIKHKKAATDAKRGKIWTRLIKEITVAAKLAGADTSTNPRLRLAIDKATDANMPKDNIQRAIQRGVGGNDGVNYEEVRYEGYGTSGVAIIVECLTDNRTRTVAEVRHAFSKYGGNMGTEGSVAFMFKHCASLIFTNIDNDAILEKALEYGADDVIIEEDSTEIICSPFEFINLKDSLEKVGFIAEFTEVGMKPQNTLELKGEESAKMQKIIDALENLDDVQNVYHNAILEEII